MILQIGEDTTRIGLRIKSWRNQRYVQDWSNLYLIIKPGQLHERDGECCHVPGSPWIVHGCWYFWPTGVDLMNPPKPDFPPFYLQSIGVDDDLLVFELPERWRASVPFGRYTGIIRYQQINSTVPVNNLKYLGAPQAWWSEPPDKSGACECRQDRPPLIMPKPRACDLVEFDIDYGPICCEHLLDRVEAELEEIEDVIP